MASRLTRKDIAERAGVSPSTVSRALAGRRDLLPAETIESICALADEMGYTKNMLASRLASNKSFQIGFVVPLNRYRGVFQLSYYSTILDAMVAEAHPRGFTVSIAPVEEGAPAVDHLCELVTSRQVDGLVIGGLKQDDPLPSILEEEKVPTVLVGSHFSGKHVASVNCDPLPAIEELVDLLSSSGYQRLYFVSGSKEYYDAQLQVAAVKKAVSKSQISDFRIIPGNYSRRSGYAAAEQIIPEVEDGDCVFLANDRMAMGFYRYCYENKVAIPDTVGVVGSDDDEAATALFPDLTTIHQPRQEMGAAAIRLMMELLDEKEDLNLSVTLEKTLCARHSLKSMI